MVIDKDPEITKLTQEARRLSMGTGARTPPRRPSEMSNGIRNGLSPRRPSDILPHRSPRLSDRRQSDYVNGGVRRVSHSPGLANRRQSDSPRMLDSRRPSEFKRESIGKRLSVESDERR